METVTLGTLVASCDDSIQAGAHAHLLVAAGGTTMSGPCCQCVAWACRDSSARCLLHCEGEGGAMHNIIMMPACVFEVHHTPLWHARAPLLQSLTRSSRLQIAAVQACVCRCVAAKT